MEALLEKGGNMESWNDERLDELSRRIDAGFNEIREEMREGSAHSDQKMQQGFEQLDNRIFRLMIMMLIFCGGQATALLGAVLTISGS